MSHNRKHTSKKGRAKLVREARELERTAARLPGVADLARLYGQHAEMVRRAQAYQRPAGKIVIIASGSAST